MPEFNPQKFDQETKRAISNIKKQLKETAYRSADFVMKMLALELSPVWTGSYILSHRVGVNSKNDSSATTMGPKLPDDVIPPKAPIAKSKAYRQQAAGRVARRVNMPDMTDSGTLIVYNASPHARLVEMLPDKYVKGNLAPYCPYLKASLKLRAEIPAIIDKVQRKYR